MSNFAIRAEHLGKKYQIGEKERYRMLRDMLHDATIATWQSMRQALNRQARSERQNRRTLWALKDVSFEIQPGDLVGIVGSNGAGKTTLLKILSRVTVPTEGRARLRGRVGSLLEVGTGFHPELTGRENIYLNGAILGMRKQEIDRKFDEIVAFSEVEKFLDTPIKFYSSGMRVRLAFSVAAHLEPEILLVDEVLAVGDVAFQKKSLGRMGEVVREGRTVLFVSHNMAALRSLCRTGLYLEKGQVQYFGDIAGAIDCYLKSGAIQNQPQVDLEPDPALPVQIVGVKVMSPEGEISSHIPHDQPFFVQIRIIVREPTYRMNLGVFLLDSDLEVIFSTHDFEQDEERLQVRQPGVYTYRLQFPPIFVPDNYRLSVRAIRAGRMGERILHNVEQVCPFEVFDNGSARSRANVPWRGKVVYPISWEYQHVPLDASLLIEQNG
jgi:lipopolysaccharide transport system ATP-binding protein